MSWNEIFKIIGTTIFSVGSASLLIFALSSWLGKVWASRILEKERRELDIYKETVLSVRNDKVATYRAAVDVVSHILSALDSHESGRVTPEDAGKIFDNFNEQRMRVYGYLAMLAPQPVMDAQDELMDHVLKITGGTEEYHWELVREKAINFLNEVRKDIGIDKNPISYNGEL
jgi:hypothetical protein